MEHNSTISSFEDENEKTPTTMFVEWTTTTTRSKNEEQITTTTATTNIKYARRGQDAGGTRTGRGLDAKGRGQTDGRD